MSPTDGYARTYQIKWADLDPNGHMRHSAYADYAADVRMTYLADNQFPLQRLRELRIGPVLLREAVDYLREVRPDGRIRVTLALASMTEDGSRWTLRHQIERDDGVKAAMITVAGGWLDLETRKLTVPPAELTTILANLPRTNGQPTHGAPPAPGATPTPECDPETGRPRVGNG